MSENNKAIVISNMDIAAIFSRLSNDRNQLFMFDKDINMEGLENYSPPREVVNNEKLIGMCSRLLKPDIMLNVTNGGGDQPIDIFKIFTNIGVKGGIAVQKTEDGYGLFELKDIKALAPTQAYARGTNAENTMENPIEDVLDVESLICVLHLIDTYRRITYRNLLNFRNEKSQTILVELFMEVMSESMKKRDTRWLMPTFVYFTEVFNKYDTELTYEKLEHLAKLGLISLETEADDKELIRFEEKGMLLALEFYKYLKSCTCVTREEVQEGLVQETDLVFIAHTELTNHYIEFITNGKQCSVKHDNITVEQLVSKFAGIFEK